jgi:hypothetical protein
VVIDELNVSSLVFDPAKDEPPLIVHSDAVESVPPIAAKKLQSVAGGRPKVAERMSGVQEVELSHGCLHNGRWIVPYTRRPSSVENIGGSAVPK